jgi:tRNA-2-methylthio-N6-dimethylallyladenosine synthase
MQRTYTREEYLEKIALIRSARRPISITTDFIVGFPGETENEFEETLSLLDAVQYDSSFSFKYSPRPNTPAQTMPDAVPEEEKVRRLAAVIERQSQIQAARIETQIGQTHEVLVDGGLRRDGRWLGRTSGNRVINFASLHTDLLGQYVQVHVKGSSAHTLVGDHVI